jgi:endonuclease YncB( thermonuclease family)
MRPTRLVFLGFLVLGVACVASGNQQTARVISVSDGDTLVVEIAGVRERVRLIGIDTPEIGSRGGAPEFFAQEAKAFTMSLAADVEVRLVDDPENTDRDVYDRLLRYVYLPDGRLLNALILEGGYGHAYTRYPFSKSDEFRDLERAARSGGAGLWNSAVVPSIPMEDLHNHMGETVTTCGPVGSTRYLVDTDGQPTFINLGRPYPDQDLTVVIWGSDRAGFGAPPESTYRDRTLCVTGKLRTQRGKPQINVRDRSQLVIEE